MCPATPIGRHLRGVARRTNASGAGGRPSPSSAYCGHRKIRCRLQSSVLRQPPPTPHRYRWRWPDSSCLSDVKPALPTSMTTTTPPCPTAPSVPSSSNAKPNELEEHLSARRESRVLLNPSNSDRPRVRCSTNSHSANCIRCCSSRNSIRRKYCRSSCCYCWSSGEFV